MDKLRLLEFRGRLAELNEIESRIEELKRTVDGVGAQNITDKIMTSSTNKSDKKIIALLEEKRHYDILMDEYESEKKVVEMNIRKLESPLERAVMRYRYIQMLDWDAIAEKMKYSERHVKRIHGEALQKSASCHTMARNVMEWHTS